MNNRDLRFTRTDTFVRLRSDASTRTSSPPPPEEEYATRGCSVDGEKDQIKNDLQLFSLTRWHACCSSSRVPATALTNRPCAWAATAPAACGTHGMKPPDLLHGAHSAGRHYLGKIQHTSFVCMRKFAAAAEGVFCFLAQGDGGGSCPAGATSRCPLAVRYSRSCLGVGGERLAAGGGGALLAAGSASGAGLRARCAPDWPSTSAAMTSKSPRTPWPTERRRFSAVRCRRDASPPDVSSRRSTAVRRTGFC